MIELLEAILAGVPRLDGAACAGDPDPDLWHDVNDHFAAARICATCPVRQECFDLGIAEGVRSETRGGAWFGKRGRPTNPARTIMVMASWDARRDEQGAA